MEPLKRLGFKISEIRKTKGLTQEELAERTALTLSYISKIETGRRNPTITTIYKISESLEVDIGDLFYEYKKGDNSSTEINKENIAGKLRLFLDSLEKDS